MATVTLGPYDPVIYAQEALIVLRRTLGFGARVYRALDGLTAQPGSTITLRRPQNFTATSMPAASSDLTPESVTITLSNWQGVTYELTDKELSYSKERMIAEHVAPAANAVGYAIDATLQALVKKIPWYTTTTAPLAVADITGVRKILATNQTPMNDGNLHLMLSPTLEEEALRNSAFSQWTGAGAAGAETQMSGSLGMKFGFETFMTQGTITHTSGVGADATGALKGAVAKGATSMEIDGVTAGITLMAGDTFVIAGNTQRYVVTANASDGDSDSDVTFSFYPAAVQAYDDDSVITINLVSGEQSLGFHRDAFALVMAQLPDSDPVTRSAIIATVRDESTGLSLRARRWYDATNAKHLMSLDALWGVQVLNPNLACRLVD